MFNNKNRLNAIIFILPSILLLSIFIYTPMFQNFYNSFFEFSVFSPSKNFIGFKNFKLLMDDKTIWIALINCVKYAIISVLMQVWGGLILAAVLEDKLFRKLAPFFRITFFMPVMISISVIGLLFGFIYNPQFGLLNSFLELIGQKELAMAWLGNSKTAIYAVIAMSQWRSIGFIMMMFIVAIQKIPENLYEAARIDGANSIRQFFHITVPQVRETIFVTTLITVTGSMLVFNEPYILTGGGPGNSSTTLAVFMYQSGFVQDKMGYASTIALMIFLISAILALIQLKFSKSEEA